MQSTASLQPFGNLALRYRRQTDHHGTAPEKWAVLDRDRTPEPRLTAGQACLLAGAGSLVLWGLIGSALWRVLG